MIQRVTFYTEEETRAILEAEAQGRPHPFPNTEAKRFGSSPSVEKRTRDLREREAGKVVQFAMWPDDKRAMPTDFLACALFAALHGKNTQHLRGEHIASINGYTVSYTGKRLTQVHADIVMGALHLMRGLPEGENVEFRIRSFLKFIGRHTGKTDRDSFRQLVDDVIATALRITAPDGKVSYSGSILTKARDVSEDDDTLFVLEVNRELAKLFDNGFGTVDWEKRKSMMRQPLCLWLQLYFAKFTKPVAVAELHRLSGSTAPLKKFRQNLRAALDVLRKKGVANAWIDRESDSVRYGPPASALPEVRGANNLKPLPNQPELPLLSPSAPVASAQAKEKFRNMYPNRDVERCLSDFGAWLKDKKLTADRPDAAFLGFAKKWAAAREADEGESRHRAS
jgi:hypothetical protein